MTHHFLYGALAQQEVLDLVLGAVGDARCATGELAGFALPDNPPPLALASACAGATLRGVVVSNLSKVQQSRLDFVAAVMGGQEAQGQCTTNAGPLTVSLRAAQQPQPSRQDKIPVAPIERNAISEIMGYWDRVPAKTVAHRRGMILARAAARQAAATPKPSQVRSSTGSEVITLHAQDATHEGFFLMRSYSLDHPKFDGTTSPALAREAFVATDAAIVLPYDPVRDRVLLVEQFRMGPLARGDAKPWMLEPVAGRVDAGESPETCARRECLEEAGLELRELVKISSHYCSPGCSSEYFHVFLGLCDLPDERPSHGGLETEHEDIALHVISYDAAQALLESGEADNGPLVLALLWLSKTREQLRASA